MRKPLVLLIAACSTCFAASDPSFAQDGSAHMQMSSSEWFAVLELPFLFMAVFFAFRTANALKGGVFGQGMMFLAWGFTVMGIGHLIMQSAKLFHVDVLAMVFGELGGAIAWVLALILTWGLSWLGFQSIYRASRGTRKTSIEAVAAES